MLGHSMQLPALLKTPIPGENHTETVYRDIKRRIIELDLAPGSSVSENELARLAGISKSPVRGALARLQRDGLVEPFARSGYRIRDITLRSTRELCEMRSILEPHAARLAAARGMPATDLNRLKILAETSLSTPFGQSQAQQEDFLRHNLEFDSIIVNAAGNERLAASIVAVFDDLERVLRLILKRLPWSAQRVVERWEIVNALGARDEEKAYATMLQRNINSHQEIIATLMESLDGMNLGSDQP